MLRGTASGRTLEDVLLSADETLADHSVHSTPSNSNSISKGHTMGESDFPRYKICSLIVLVPRHKCVHKFVCKKIDRERGRERERERARTRI